jgi:hypothetical protein
MSGVFCRDLLHFSAEAYKFAPAEEVSARSLSVTSQSGQLHLSQTATESLQIFPKSLLSSDLPPSSMPGGLPEPQLSLPRTVQSSSVPCCLRGDATTARLIAD